MGTAITDELKYFFKEQMYVGSQLYQFTWQVSYPHLNIDCPECGHSNVLSYWYGFYNTHFYLWPGTREEIECGHCTTTYTKRDKLSIFDDVWIIEVDYKILRD